MEKLKLKFMMLVCLYININSKPGSIVQEQSYNLRDELLEELKKLA